MSLPITERILSTNKFYTDKYIKNNINLTKSIIFVNSKEASLYNEYININYPEHKINLTDKTTWRYYKHLAKQYHELDKPITLTSIDNGETIILTPENLLLHRITHTELLKYDLFYKEIIDRYLEQELYIKSVISTSNNLSIKEIVNLEDFTIVSYNLRLVEENEDDLIYQLQYRINNYKNTKLIQYYSVTDNLFIASQYHILYTFILTTLISLRLSNAKTLKAHSYHILNYLSSHHYLDIHYNYLTKKQSLFLYRNLLYLDNHSGQNETLFTLINKLFTERNISVVNYTYSQSNSTDTNNYMKYKFKQKLLNDSNLVYSYQDYSLEDVLLKEEQLNPGNLNYIKYSTDAIDMSYKNMLYDSLLTKDIDTVTVDSTDSVKYKLIPMLVDYWAYLLKLNKINFLVSILDPVSNQELRLNTKDLFKLYSLVLYKLNNQELTEFKPYLIERVFKQNLPSKDTLLNYFYRKHIYQNSLIDKILYSVPRYDNVITSYQFEQFLTSVYKLNIGLWLFTCNLHDKDNEGQFDNLISNIHTSTFYTFNDETTEQFLKRINLENLYDFPTKSLEDISFSILNNLFDNKLSFLNKYKYIQQSLIEILKKFNSYTIQIINNYYQNAPILSGISEPRLTIDENTKTDNYLYDTLNLNLEIYYSLKEEKIAQFNFDIQNKQTYKEIYKIQIEPDLNIKTNSNEVTSILFNMPVVNDVISNDQIEDNITEEHKLFLAFNI